MSALGQRVRRHADRGGADRARGELHRLGLHLKPLSLDWRPGLVVAITIPLVLAITFVVMYYAGVGLHKISLGSLIIALGLLVDDAIIAVEMMVRKLEEGFDKVRAATFAYEATAMPMLTGTLITAVGFLPIGMAQVDGRRVHLRDLRRDRRGAADLVAASRCTSCRTSAPCCLQRRKRAAPTRRAARALRHAVLRALPRASSTWCVAAPLDRRSARPSARSSLGVAGMGAVQQQFFPDSSRPEIIVDLWLPEGTSFAANEAVTKRVEARLRRHRRRRQRHDLGRQRRRALRTCRSTRSFRRRNVSQMIVHAART